MSCRKNHRRHYRISTTAVVDPTVITVIIIAKEPKSRVGGVWFWGDNKRSHQRKSALVVVAGGPSATFQKLREHILFHLLRYIPSLSYTVLNRENTYKY